MWLDSFKNHIRQLLGVLGARPGPHHAEMLAVHDRLVDRTHALAQLETLHIRNDFSLRFEIMVLLTTAVLYRLRHAGSDRVNGEPPACQEGIVAPPGDPDAVAALWEITFEGFEYSLRQHGVNDIRISARMRKLLMHATGRRNAYLLALEDSDPDVLRHAIGRNVLNGAEPDDPRIDRFVQEVQSLLAG
jgi:hypothetical protein